MLVFDFSEICEIYKTLDITKRNFLKILAMFYDPIGLLQPILINLKRFFRRFVNKMASIKNALSKIINISNYFYWTDSMVTLAWIISKGKDFKTFIENRIREIRENIHISRWFHCESKSNPADLLTLLFVFSNMIYGGGAAHFYVT